MWPSASSTSYLLLVGVLTSSVTGQGIVYVEENTTQDGHTVLLGGLFPIHRPGPSRINLCGNVRMSAVQLVESMVYSIQTINQDPTLLPTVTLSFDIRDTCTSVNYALQQSVDYIQSISNGICNAQQTLGVSGVLGAALSTVSQASANLFGLFEIPQISYGSTSSLLSDGDQFTYFFRTIPSDSFQVRVIADIIVHFEWTYIIALYSNDLYGISGIAEFIKELGARTNASTCVAVQILLNDNPASYEFAVDLMSQAWVSNASVALLFGHTQNAVGILAVIKRRLAADQYFPLQNITWIGSDSWGANLLNEYRPMASGMLGVVPLARSHQGFSEYFASLNTTNNIDNPWFMEFWESLFNCSLGPSPSLPGCDLDNQAIPLDYSQFNQVPLVFDAVYALALSIDNLINTHCSNGSLCSEITTPSGAVNGSMVREQLFNVSFINNARERVKFDINGDVQQATYSIFNLQETSDNVFSFEHVGSWDDENRLVISGNIKWNTGQDVPSSRCSLPCKIEEVRRLVPDEATCCFTCESCIENTISSGVECVACSNGTVPSENRTTCLDIPLTFLRWSDIWGIAIVVITSIGMIATVIVIIVFGIHWKHEIIKASSRELSAIILGGIFLCYIIPFIYIVMPSAAICGIQRFSIGFCFTISYSALLVKTNRIYRIFNVTASSVKGIRFISPLSQVLFTLALTGVQVLISVIWLIAEPPGTEILLSRTSRELRCRASPYIGFSVFLGYNFVLLILSTYYAFRTRNVPANFNETKFVSITLYTICIIWLAFIPIHFSITMFGVLFETVSLVLGVILSAGTTLCCLFISKVIFLFTRIKTDKTIEQSNSVSKM